MTGCPDNKDNDSGDAWHDAYVAGNCDACPDCCVSDEDMDAAGEEAGDAAGTDAELPDDAGSDADSAGDAAGDASEQ